MEGIYAKGALQFDRSSAGPVKRPPLEIRNQALYVTNESNFRRPDISESDLLYTPARARNAIAQYSVSVQLFQPIMQRDFESILAALSTASETLDLPAKAKIPTIPFMAPASLSQADLPQSFIGYERFAPDGTVAERLVCDSDEIVYTSANYHSWENEKKRFSPVICKLLSEYLAKIPAVKHIRVQYMNEYRPCRPVADPSDIVKADSKWVAGIFSSTGEFWHSHVGAFLEDDERDDLHYLINVNCDSIGGEEEDRTLKIGIMSSCSFDIPGKTPLLMEPTDDVESMLSKYLDKAHDNEKSVLHQIISEKYYNYNKV